MQFHIYICIFCYFRLIDQVFLHQKRSVINYHSLWNDFFCITFNKWVTSLQKYWLFWLFHELSPQLSPVSQTESPAPKLTPFFWAVLKAPQFLHFSETSCLCISNWKKIAHFSCNIIIQVVRSLTRHGLTGLYYIGLTVYTNTPENSSTAQQVKKVLKEQDRAGPEECVRKKKGGRLLSW